MTIPEQAVQAAIAVIRAHDNEAWGEDCGDEPYVDLVTRMLTAAAPYMRYKREFNISSCTVDLSGADYKCFLDGVTGFEVSLDGETRYFGEYNEGDRVFFDAETGDLDAHDLFILSRPAFEKKVQERISALTAAAPHMSGVKVKQLEWSVLGRMHKADLYEIEDMGPNWSKDRYQLWYNKGVLQGVFGTLDEAKSAAQEDFEDNVRECIDGGFEVSSVREQALEEAAILIDEGFDKAVGKSWRNDGKPSKNDMCPHDKFMYEDCERCASDAIRALKSQPAPQTGGGE